MFGAKSDAAPAAAVPVRSVRRLILILFIVMSVSLLRVEPDNASSSDLGRYAEQACINMPAA
jgi:hypothetical protein